LAPISIARTPWALDFAAARKHRRALHRDGVDVRGGARTLASNAVLVRLELQLPQQPPDTLGALTLVDVVQRLEPFPVFQLDPRGLVCVSLSGGHLQRLFLFSVFDVLKQHRLVYLAHPLRDRSWHLRSCLQIDGPIQEIFSAKRQKDLDFSAAFFRPSRFPVQHFSWNMIQARCSVFSFSA